VVSCCSPITGSGTGWSIWDGLVLYRNSVSIKSVEYNSNETPFSVIVFGVLYGFTIIIV
jgi:hypothetical protein